MKKYTLLKISFLALMIFTLFNCEKDSNLGVITLQLDHGVKGNALEIEKIIYPCEAGHTFSVVNLKYYISEIVFHKKDGSSYSSDKVHLSDIHEPSTGQLAIVDIPDGDYNSLSFVFGLNETKNIDGGLENTVRNINMEWPIPGDQGYHYMKFEGRYDSLNTGVIRSFNVHTGATMGNQNYFEVTLPFTETNIQSNSWMIKINMDLNEWLQDPHTFDFTGNERIMMNQSAQEILKGNGMSVFSLTSITENQ